MIKIGHLCTLKSIYPKDTYPQKEKIAVKVERNLADTPLIKYSKLISLVMMQMGSQVVEW